MYNLTKEFMGIPEKIILRSDSVFLLLLHLYITTTKEIGDKEPYYNTKILSGSFY